MEVNLKSGFVTLFGLPNAGKSSLLNRLTSSDLAIVTPKAQTTWKNLKGFVVRPDVELVVVDTPGIQDGTKALNAALAKNATAAVASAREGREVLVLMIDSPSTWKNSQAFENLVNKVNIRTVPIIPVFNKADLFQAPEQRDGLEAKILPMLKEKFPMLQPHHWVSCRYGDASKSSVEKLLEAIKELLPVGQSGELFDPEIMSDRPEREFVSEFIREQCFFQLGAELPYSIAVQIEDYDEKDPELCRIRAILHVERESQQKVVIGAGGSKIKEIGTKARGRIEHFLGRKVFLGLKVKITPQWSREEKWIKRFGYVDQ